jgi:diguanylate cyclase (GGDEF)-like protein
VILRKAFRVSCSIGMAGIDDHEKDVDKILKKSDEALYKAKAQGKNVLAISGDEIHKVRERQVERTR